MHAIDEEVKEFWDRVAEDWEIQVGDDGDNNRLLNSDPVLWQFLGDVRGFRVLDAGCGTGYLTRKLVQNDALVTGVDISPKMLEIARRKSIEAGLNIEYHVDSCSQLKSCRDASYDTIVSNYVLMDIPDLEATIKSFNRVLKPKGTAVLVFSHPCFPQGKAIAIEPDELVLYEWSFSYFKRQKCIEKPWGHFKSEFIWFHRPLSDYWKAFKSFGFDIIDFEEPRITDDRFHLAKTERILKNSRFRPYSVAFKLQKIEEVEAKADTNK
ncbi:MAG: class I SAM-dependent methyltransferase [Cyanosarcina radialis HA8281-LM2]|jgi:ubiquinone/menaquinone biosynthesis C-methylase UbiE|nr:class I SAM-dependent methyltransferase [Cyanosarcina radialis HA8281-LM2]